MKKKTTREEIDKYIEAWYLRTLPTVDLDDNGKTYPPPPQNEWATSVKKDLLQWHKRQVEEIIGKNEKSLYRQEADGTWWLDGVGSSQEVTPVEVYFDPCSVRNGLRRELRAKLKGEEK